MATRFYLNGGGIEHDGPYTVPFSAPWAGGVQSDSRVRHLPSRLLLPGDFTGKAISFNYTGQFATIFHQFVSDPLKAQTISGTVKGQIRCMQDSADANMQTLMSVKVLSEDGQTERAVLYAGFTSSLVTEISTSTLVNRKIPHNGPVDLTSYTCVDGDRLVVEIGTKCFKSINGTYTTTFDFGGGEADTDLPEDETSTTQARPWVEFSDDIVFLPCPEKLADWNPDKLLGIWGTASTTVTSPTLEGTHCAKFQLTSGVQNGMAVWYESNEEEIEGETRWYHFMSRFEAPWTSPTGWALFYELHPQAGAYAEQAPWKFDATDGSGNPAITLILQTGEYTSSWEYDRRHTILPTLPTDENISFLFQVELQRTATGLFRVWTRQGNKPKFTLRLNLRNIPTLVWSAAHGLIQAHSLLGFYRNLPSSFTNTVYHDFYFRTEDLAGVRQILGSNIGVSDSPRAPAGSATATPVSPGSLTLPPA